MFINKKVIFNINKINKKTWIYLSYLKVLFYNVNYDIDRSFIDVEIIILLAYFIDIDIIL